VIPSPLFEKKAGAEFRKSQGIKQVRRSVEVFVGKLSSILKRSRL
jgi:hypothetical protein